jgi:DNA-binding XRE family transcriptional regulator
MIMARNFNELRAKMSPESRARVEARVKETIENMPLVELRNAREMTQENLSKVLGVPQSSISKMERRTDMYLSTLRSYIEAMGGRLEMRAVFSTGAVNVDLGEQEGREDYSAPPSAKLTASAAGRRS